MKYKAGDRVKIKSFDWYNENKDINGNVHCGDKVFDNYMSVFCGSIVTIGGVYPYNAYDIREDMHCRAWTDEMIECKVESVEDGMKELRKMCTISLTDSNYSDKIEVLLNNYEYIEEDGKAFFVKKKKEYPKTYEECLKILGFTTIYTPKVEPMFDYDDDIIALQKLKNCRNAYWKIAGEEMGLGKPWKPDWDAKDNHFYTIYTFNGKIECSATAHRNAVLIFPTEEMRDAFYENFKEEIEKCKELL